MKQNEDRQVRPHLTELVERLRSAAGDNLHSVVLYGSAASSDFHENFSDLNILCLLRDLSASSMLGLSDTVKWCKKQKHPIPLFLTVNELVQAADVFAIELLDMKQHHRVLYGDDLVAALDVPLRMHRVQVEHELRTKLILLRQTFVTRSQNSAETLKLMLESVSSFITLFRHSLIAMGEEPESPKRAMLQQLQKKINVDVKPFLELLDIREGRLKPNAFDALGVFPVYITTVEQVISAVDRL